MEEDGHFHLEPRIATILDALLGCRPIAPANTEHYTLQGTSVAINPQWSFDHLNRVVFFITQGGRLNHLPKSSAASLLRSDQDILNKQSCCH